MITKYGFEISKEVVIKNIDRLTNQVWKLIPMFENNEDWKKQLNTVKIEIAGLYEIFNDNPQFLQLLSKLEGIDVSEIAFEHYRSSIFEAISLLQGMKK